MKRTRIPTRARLLAVAAWLALAAPALPAQTVYRVVGPDGSVIFSDQPPVSKGKASTLPPGTPSTAPAVAPTVTLPLALRQAVSKFPVTLYAGDGCEPCNHGRTLLASRGIPFTERTVTTVEDAEALQQLSGQKSLPMLTIGKQRLTGFMSLDWSQYLDAAGYPASSLLPSGYRNPPASPLALAAPKPVKAPAEAAPESAPPPPAAAPAQAEPTDIKF